MARNDVTITLNAKDAEAVRAWQRMKQGIGAAEQELSRMGKTSQRSGRQASAGLRSVAANSARAVAGVAGIGSAIAGVLSFVQLLRKELGAVTERRREFANQQVTVGDASQRAFRALGDPSLQAEVEQRILADTSGVPLAEKFLVAETAFSSAGKKIGPKRAIDTALDVFNFAPDLDVDALKAVTEAALAFQKGFPESKPEEAIAAVFQTLSTARQTNVADFARNVAPAIAQARAFSAKPGARQGTDEFRDLAALFVGVGQRSGDPQGRFSRTAVLKFLEQINQEALQAGLIEKGEGPLVAQAALLSGRPKAEQVRKKLLGVFGAEADEAREGAAGSPELRSEAQAKIAILELLQPGSQTLREVQAAREAILGLNQASVRFAKNMRDAINAMDSQLAPQLRRIREGTVSGIRQEPREALLQETADALADFLVTSGGSKTIADAKQFLDPLVQQSEDVDELLTFFRGEVEKLQRGLSKESRLDVTADPLAPGALPFQGIEARRREPTPLEKLSAEKLEAAIEQVDELIELRQRRRQSSRQDGPRPTDQGSLDELLRGGRAAGKDRAALERLAQTQPRQATAGEFDPTHRPGRGRAAGGVEAPAAGDREPDPAAKASAETLARVERLLERQLALMENEQRRPVAPQPQPVPLQGLERLG